MRIAVLLLALLLSGCANFQLPSWAGGKAASAEPKHRAPQPVAREPSAPAPAVDAQSPAQTVPVEPSPLPRKRKYEED